MFVVVVMQHTSHGLLGVPIEIIDSLKGALTSARLAERVGFRLTHIDEFVAIYRLDENRIYNWEEFDDARLIFTPLVFSRRRYKGLAKEIKEVKETWTEEWWNINHISTEEFMELVGEGYIQESIRVIDNSKPQGYYFLHFKWPPSQDKSSNDD